MTKISLLSDSNPNPKPYLTLELSIASERLRQAHHSFNLALVATTVSFCISVIGAGLLLSGKVPEGTVTAASGLASSVLCIQLAKDTNEKLDKILTELKDQD
ncbi:hypothetical protein G7B40_041045 [Aetokthonos hydrillicola Thurmond2011]|jgi:uncharacterized membrane protein YczE|uniref:Cyanobacterial TRADD-N associated 2 transmembrane domain-containing protein n=1 Tax=Aetokthonos hydrillicola Thurmond2011 TaxID=2712845 RepID=A0AAP5MEF4_9CYAN|nr:hypothetical protein [Aetokthonos hydrillicola]MBO3463024.1 hypothetical protein [Aetokthonos hydrillicola CCALA 1050]MBW4590841.1 hypothetical protein [Aetokthonos hydrillicola CCALA 1050]MDR9900874.1 hypothetical protein [Aetokthonos hydrillicola Thurmond2011]